MAKYHLGQVKVEPGAGQRLPSGIVVCRGACREFRGNHFACYSFAILPRFSHPYSPALLLGEYGLMVSMTGFSTELLSLMAWFPQGS